MEEWKDVVGYEGLYQVSNEGRVARLLKNGRRLLNTQYNKVSLCKNNVKQTMNIDAIVGMAFLPQAELMECLDHINGDKTDNRVSNLQWSKRTLREKVIDTIRLKNTKGIDYWIAESEYEYCNSHGEMIYFMVAMCE